MAPTLAELGAGLREGFNMVWVFGAIIVFFVLAGSVIYRAEADEKRRPKPRKSSSDS